jgi:branched-chain amino acid transport system substrate-binding protein
VSVARLTPRRTLVALVAVGLSTAACGTVLPNSAFTSASGGSSVGGTVASPSNSSGPSTGPSTSSGRAGSQGRAGQAGSQGQTITLPGQSVASPGPASASGCKGVANNDPSIGVTPTTVAIGNVYSGPNNPFAPNQFDVSYYGIESYVNYLDDAVGGVCGRKVILYKCDDNGDSNADVNCVHTLIDQDHVLALVGSNVYQYSGAPYVSQTDTPDIGGQPITGSAYYTYPHLYDIEGSYYANDGTPPSDYWGPYGLGLFFKNYLHITRAGVISYAQADSERGANYIIGWLQHAGIQVDSEEVPLFGNPGPNVQDMQERGDQAVFDTLDLDGDQRVCEAMQEYGYNVPKISTISVWTQQYGQTMSGYPCLNDSYAWGLSSNYGDTSNSEVALFREAYDAFAPGAPLSQWSLEGWAAGMWFADALASCGLDVTKACIENYVNTPVGFTADGLLDPHSTRFPHWTSQPATLTQCYTIVKWEGGANGDWATIKDHNDNCYTTPSFTYANPG